MRCASTTAGTWPPETYHRHQVPENGEFAVWDQFRNADGSPRYPQRPLLLGPMFAAAAAGTVQTGRFEGKMIVVESLLDREASRGRPTGTARRCASTWARPPTSTSASGSPTTPCTGTTRCRRDPLHTVSYLGMLHQALRDVSRWVEEGVAPPASTDYQVVDGQVVRAARRVARRGMQPVVSLDRGRRPRGWPRWGAS